jgi:hypothetical protein
MALMNKRTIVIRNLNMEPMFALDFYGEKAKMLTVVPGGGNIVAEALQKRGIDPKTVIFSLWDVR